MKRIIVLIVIISFVVVLVIRHRIINKYTKEQEEKKWAEIGLYFYDKDAQWFVRVPRKVLQKNNTPYFALQELIRGPHSKSHIPVIPKNVKVKKFYVQSDIAIVDFDKNLLNYGGGATQEIGIIGGVVLTLTDFKEIKCVQFLIDGNKHKYLPEGIEILKPVCRKEFEKLVKK